MNHKAKKMAAALAAVTAYLQEEEAASYNERLTIAPPSGPPVAAVNLWGQSGRQSMMQLRSLMQLRALHRF